MKTASPGAKITGAKNPQAGNWPKKRFKQGQPAFTLIECLIGLSLSLFILLSSVEMFTLARRFSVKFKEEQETSLAVANALEKIREDAEKAGQGLEAEAGQPEGQPEAFCPVFISAGHLFLYSQDEELFLSQPAEAGQNFIPVKVNRSLAEKLKKGRNIFLSHQIENKVEFFSITNFTGDRIYLSGSLTYDYRPEGSRASLLEKVEYFFDREQKILRRRVNDTSSQPLLEQALGFEPDYSPATNLLTVKIIVGQKKEKVYEVAVFPKNIFKNPWL
ncbi:MAG: hypothetical protein ACPLRX_05545 [Candidatus Saccharicenans sp.]